MKRQPDFLHISGLAAVGMMMIFFSPRASAQDGYGAIHWDWQLGTGDPQRRWRHTYRQRYYRPDVHYYRTPEDRPSAEQSDLRSSDDWHCLGPVRGLGTQGVGAAGNDENSQALSAAQKDWMERVRFDHGESYVDLSNARGEIHRCNRTSVGEIANQVLYRCEMWAQPCKAKFKFDRAEYER